MRARKFAAEGSNRGHPRVQFGLPRGPLVCDHAPADPDKRQRELAEHVQGRHRARGRDVERLPQVGLAPGVLGAQVERAR